jgi:hypothetical protein
MPDERAKPAMMCALGPGASRRLTVQPLARRPCSTTPRSLSRHLVHRPHLIAQIYMMPALDPPHSQSVVRDRWDSPPRVTCGPGYRACPSPVGRRSLREMPSDDCRNPTIRDAKSRIACFWKDDCASAAMEDPAAVEPFSPALSTGVLTQSADQQLHTKFNTQ